jgi:hypothetical protein
MAECFGHVADHLSGVRSGLMDLAARLADLDRVLLDQQSQGRVLDGVQESASDLRAALVCAADATAPQRITTASKTALESLAEIDTRTRMLDAVANLTLITAKSLRLEGFDDYVINLRALGRDMGEDADRLGRAVSALRQRRERAGVLFGRATASLDQVQGALQTHAHARTETGRLLAATIDGVSMVAARLSGVIASETDSLVQAMQFADAAAQRLDHIGTILAQGGPAEQALAAAQIEALVAATRDTVTGVLNSLARVQATAADAGRVLTADGAQRGNAATDAVDLGRSLLTTLAEASSEALADIDGAVAESAALSDLADEAANRFESLAAATASIHLAAINAALLSRTDNGQERAVSVLSIDVQQQAAACASASASCKAAISQLILPADLDTFGAVAPRAEAFRRAVTETSAGVAAAGAALATMGRLRGAASDSLAALGPVIRTARQSMDGIMTAAKDLAQVAAGLPQTPPPGTGPLAHLLELYTMEAERAVHRRVFGLPEVPMAPVEWGSPAAAMADTADDPLAAILF